MAESHVGHLYHNSPKISRRSVIILKINGLRRLECDFVAQAFQLAHRPAGDGCLVPLLKILVPQVHKGPPGLDNVMENYGDSVGHGRPLGSDAPGEAPILGPPDRSWSARRPGPPPPRPALVKTGAGLSQLFPFRTGLRRRFSPLRRFPGHTPAHDARWPGVGKRSMSVPISATTSAVRRPT